VGVSRGPRPGFDPYEDAGDRLERARQAREEIGDPQPHLPPELRIGRVPRLSTRAVVIAFAAFLGLGTVAVVTSPGSEQPAGDCRTSSVSVRPGSTARGQPVVWFATGPEGRYAVTVGVAELSLGADDEPVISRTDQGNERDASVEGEAFGMDDCRGTGRFLLRQGRGEQVVRLYRLDSAVRGSGGRRTAEAVAETRLASRGG